LKTKISNIEKKICEIENLNSGDIDMNRKRHLENELNSLIDNKAKGAEIRSRIIWIEKGGKKKPDILFSTPRVTTSNLQHY
jgi:hypothetical protein